VDDIQAIVDAIIESGGRSFGPLAAAYAAAGLELPTLWLAPVAANVELDEQRDLLAWWQALAGTGLPAVAHIDPMALRPHLGSLTLLEPTGDGDFIYRLHGSHIAEAVGYELTGRKVSEGPRNAALPPPIRDYFHAIYRVTMARGQPLFARHHWRKVTGDPLLWHRLVLPFGDAAMPQRLLVSNIPQTLIR
jgi:hypothetical protein